MYNVLLLKDNFEDGKWNVISGKWGYKYDETKVLNTFPDDSLSRCVIGSELWDNVSLNTKIKVNGWGSEIFRTAGVLLRFLDTNNYYILGFEFNNPNHEPEKMQLVIKRKYAGVITILETKDFELEFGKYYTLEAAVINNKLILYVNGREELFAFDDSLKTGRAGLISCFGDVYYDDLVINRILDINKPGPTNTGPTNPERLVKTNTFTVTKDGAVIENVDVTGYINIKASNVTIRNFRVTAARDTYYPIRIFDGFTNVVLEDGEINGSGVALANILGVNYTARRLNIHHSGADGLKGISNTNVEKCWIHHLGMMLGAHADGIQISRGSNFRIVGNNFDMPIDEPGTLSNATVFIKPDLGNIENVLIDGNWLNGGNYTIYSVDLVSLGVVKNTTKNVVITNNRFGRKYKYGIKNVKPDTVWKDNVWDDDGTQVP